MCKVVPVVSSSVQPSCCVRRALKKGCRIRLTGVQSYILIDMDHEDAPISADSKKCDYLLVGLTQRNDLEWVVPLELKRGDLDRNSFEQLQAGAKVAERLIPSNLKSGVDFEFRPVAAFGGHVHRGVRDFFQNNEIKFRNNTAAVSWIRCDSALQNVLVKKKNSR